MHFDRRYGTPACSGTTAGYPTLRRGSRGCYVMILQDALSTLGYQTGSRIDGLFGTRTEEALRGYQRRTSLTVDGVCGCNSWKKDHDGCDRHWQNKNDDRLRNRKKLRREGGASLQSVAKPLSHASRDSPLIVGPLAWRKAVWFCQGRPYQGRWHPVGMTVGFIFYGSFGSVCARSTG